MALRTKLYEVRILHTTYSPPVRALPAIMTTGPFPISSPQSATTGQAAEDNFEHQKPAPPRFRLPPGF